MSFSSLISKNKLVYQIISTPKKLGLSCSLSLKVKEEDMNDILYLLKEKKVVYNGIYKVVGDTYKKI